MRNFLGSVLCTLLFACSNSLLLVAAQYGYGGSATAVASPLDTIKLAIANRSPQEFKTLGVDLGIVRRAQQLLDDGLRIPATERMDIPWAGVKDIPMFWCAYQFFLQYGNAKAPINVEVRQLLLSLLDAGMSADIDFLGEGLIQNSWISLPLADCLNSREDVAVCLAIMKAGHPTDPVIGNWNAYNAYGQQCVLFGLGLLVCWRCGFTLCAASACLKFAKAELLLWPVASALGLCKACPF